MLSIFVQNKIKITDVFYCPVHPTKGKGKYLKNSFNRKPNPGMILDASNFSLVMPVPGTPIFDYCTKNGQLPKDYNPDKFQWTKANLTNLAVPPDELQRIRQRAWEECNTQEHRNSRLQWTVPEGEDSVPGFEKKTKKEVNVKSII